MTRSIYFIQIIHERSEFLLGVSDKNEYENNGPTWPMPTLLRGFYLRDCGFDFHTVFTGG